MPENKYVVLFKALIAGDVAAWTILIVVVAAMIGGIVWATVRHSAKEGEDNNTKGQP